MNKVPYRVKVVPIKTPNADGKWIEVNAPPLPKNARWIDAVHILDAHVPEGHFAVRYELKAEA